MQRTARRVADQSFDLPPLPSRVISMDGQLVDTSSVCWRFRSSSDGGKTYQLSVSPNGVELMSLSLGAIAASSNVVLNLPPAVAAAFTTGAREIVMADFTVQ